MVTQDVSAQEPAEVNAQYTVVTVGEAIVDEQVEQLKSVEGDHITVAPLGINAFNTALSPG